ncbi:unnamed protein product [Symbiodinium necroappetens]|uniref:Uncharacterized protein n=1 Tax=Symbiodinium necroappetens TaxID=1628268 RepID=A0A813CEA6_9DINO|nr:unnamed protein product [Symbiodinium necroappetens]
MPAFFSFFRSREFFVADDCGSPTLQPTLRKMPRALEDRKKVLEQRFKAVKMLREGVHSALHDQSAFLKKMNDAASAKMNDLEYFPAVELHMFPEDPLNATANWQALLVPTVPEAFGKTLRLCHKDAQQATCIAELPFPRLPRHLRSLASSWDPLDRLRSTPIWLNRLGEGSLLLGMLLLVVATACLTLMWCGQNSEKLTFSMPKLPVKYLLAHHAELYPDAGGMEEPLLVLDAGIEVVVEEVSSATRYISFKSVLQEWQELYRRAFRSPSAALWGRLKKPTGWILLHEEHGPVSVLAEPMEASLQGHPDLVPSLLPMIRKNAFLCGAYLSAQWLAMARLTAVFGRRAFAFLVCILYLLHLLVLLQQALSFHHGLEHEELLTQRKLLRLAPTHLLTGIFWLLVLPVVPLLVHGMRAAFSESPQLSALAVICTCVLLHAKHLHDATSSHNKWREPQIQSKEYVPFTALPLQMASDAPTKLTYDGALKWLAAKAVKMIFAWLASCALAMILLDLLQMRGQLLKYDVSRGHLTSPGSREAFHNTLLLDTNADSLTLNVELFDHTRDLLLKVEHPLLNDTELVRFNESGEHQISIPPGPLYGRISLWAVGSYADTNYTIHVIRVAPAIKVSVNSSFNSSKHPSLADVRFYEERRLQYLLEYPTWYVPDVDMAATSAIEVSLDSVVLAPMALDGQSSDVPTVSPRRCSHVCGPRKAGFGNACVYEQAVELPVPLCVGLHSPQQLDMDTSDLSVAGKNSTLLDWLRDVNVSGKFVMLDDFSTEDGTMHWPFDAAVVGLHNSFSLSTSLSSLAGSVQLEIAVTQDPTSAEQLRIPLQIVAHPPAVQLALNCSTGSTCFFLPEFNMESPRTEYALCGAETQNVSVWVDDPRFTIRATDSAEATQCTGHGQVMRTEYRVSRAESEKDCPWREYYVPWDSGYDLVVRRSILKCLEMAVDSQAVKALGSILETTRYEGRVKRFEVRDLMGAEMLLVRMGLVESADNNPCVDDAGLLGASLRKTPDIQMAKLMLEMDANPSAKSGQDTPLQIAAARGNMAAMHLLLGYKAATKGSLAVAASRCQIKAMELLIAKEKQGKIDNEKDENEEEEEEEEDCDESPFGDVFEEQPWFNCTEVPVLRKVMELLENGTRCVPDTNCKGYMLQTAIHHKDAQVTRVMLERGADANLVEGFTPLGMLMQQREKEPVISLETFVVIAKLLKDYGMDINRPTNLAGDRVLTEAAKNCDLEVAGALLKLGADPTMTNHGAKNASQVAQDKCGKEAARFQKLLATQTYIHKSEP